MRELEQRNCQTESDKRDRFHSQKSDVRPNMLIDHVKTPAMQVLKSGLPMTYPIRNIAAKKSKARRNASVAG